MTDRLKKAAILIASLDAASADALLDEMPPEEAARVRNAVMQLEDIDPQEQQRVMQEFVHRKSRGSKVSDAGVELDLSSEGHVQSLADDAVLQSVESAVVPAARPFQFLDHVQADTLAGVLSREHPQTIAIVIAHLSAARAADVLRRLPAEVQTECLMRIARLNHPHHEVIRDIEHEMRSLLSDHAHREPIEAQGFATVEAILKATPDQQRRGLVRDLTQLDQTLALRLAEQNVSGEGMVSIESRHVEGWRQATRLSPRNTGSPNMAEPRETRAEIYPPSHALPFRFADLEQLEDAALAEVLHNSSPNTTLLALTGASHAFMQRILEQMPAREAAQLQDKIQQIGPLRLSDVERAQLRLAQTAQRLIAEGRITWPASRRFAVAA